MIEEGKEVEIIFVSSDRDESSFNQYYASMPWIAIPFNSSSKQTLAAHYNVRGIPTLVVLNGNGDIMDGNGRQTVEASKGDTATAWGKWCK
jgi:nucleoredoxin